MVDRVVTEPVAVAKERETRVLETLSLLIPFDLEGERKIRYGKCGDGSYVLIDRCRPDQDVVSFGIGPSIEFETDMASRGHKVFMFDHTVDALPNQHPGFVWTREGICAGNAPTNNLRSLQAHLERLALKSESLILKIDVEGAEWEIFAEMPEEVLTRFEQIAFEAHELQRIQEADFSSLVKRALCKLRKYFTLCHVHANNFGYVKILDNIPVVDTLELTYIRNGLCNARSSATLYPTDCDTPNFPELPEIRLWFYPFMPGSQRMGIDSGDLATPSVA